MQRDLKGFRNVIRPGSGGSLDISISHVVAASCPSASSQSNLLKHFTKEVLPMHWIQHQNGAPPPPHGYLLFLQSLTAISRLRRKQTYQADARSPFIHFIEKRQKSRSFHSLEYSYSSETRDLHKYPWHNQLPSTRLHPYCHQKLHSIWEGRMRK